MPLTRKQAWRRVRVFHKTADTNEDTSPRCSNKRLGRDMKQQQQQQQQQRQRQERSPERAPTPAPANVQQQGGGDVIGSPEKRVLDKWRLPKEGREPSARPGVSAAKRQAAAVCVRVGSRVSFNTVVAAILIPSAKDLHAAARNELWWQETDYRDFRVNFIQFMRTPPSIAAADDAPEMVPVDIVAESQPPLATSSPEEVEQRGATAAIATTTAPAAPTVDAAAAAASSIVNTDVKPVVVGVGGVYYDDPVCRVSTAVAACEEKEPCVVARAWAVEPEQRDEAAARRDACCGAVAAAAAAADGPTASTAASTTTRRVEKPTNDDDPAVETPTTCLLTPPPGCGDVDVSSPVGGGSAGAGASPGSVPLSRVTSDCCTAGDDQKDGGAVAADSGGSWDEQERTQRVAPSLDWGSTTSEDGGGEDDDDGEDDGDGNMIRVRRAFSNLETARRRGAGLDSDITSEDTSDSDDDRDEDDGACEVVGKRGHRPRALSLDGWFTCGLEKEAVGKSYETHDHAGRLRDLVKLAPFPTVCVTPPRSRKPNEVADVAEMLRQLRVTLNVSVKNGGTDAKKASTAVVGNGVSPGRESKSRGECSDNTATGSKRELPGRLVVGGSSTSTTTTVAAHIDLCVS